MGLDIISSLFGNGRKTSRKYRYRLVRGRRTISRHFTKGSANKARKKNRGAKVRSIRRKRR